jgi:hypothetical protein
LAASVIFKKTAQRKQWANNNRPIVESLTNRVTLAKRRQQQISFFSVYAVKGNKKGGEEQCGQMSLRKKSPKMKPKHFSLQTQN